LRAWGRGVPSSKFRVPLSQLRGVSAREKIFGKSKRNMNLASSSHKLCFGVLTSLPRNDRCFRFQKRPAEVPEDNNPSVKSTHRNVLCLSHSLQTVHNLAAASKGAQRSHVPSDPCTVHRRTPRHSIPELERSLFFAFVAFPDTLDGFPKTEVTEKPLIGMASVMGCGRDTRTCH
jgi:hypothetical protein